MAKKPSGLGRGLGDLLDDNTPEIRKSNTAKVIIRTETQNISVTTSDIYPNQHKNKSLKANYKK